MTFRRSLAVSVALVVGLVPIAGQTPLPADPTIRTGALASGLQYSLVTSAIQPDRVFVQLAVKAGSIDEADDQRGVAHLLEHMAFNGSAHFKPGEMTGYFQATGARVGAHINALTRFDTTVYFMDVAAQRDVDVRRALEAVRDVADGLTLDAAELVRERKVIVEEWRGRQGVGERQRQPLDAALLGGSRYAERPVLGDIDRLPTVSIDTVRRFYREQYHPDRMAVVMVGGLPVSAMEARLHEAFDTMRPNPSRPRAVPDVPRHAGTRYAAFTDPELRSATVEVMFVQPYRPVRTVEGLRAGVLESMAAGLISQRLATIARGPAAPFRAASVTKTTIAMNTTLARFTAVTDGQANTALTALLRELARAREHGFSDEELSRARTGAASAFLLRPASNRVIADRLTSNFLRGEPVPSPSQLFQAAQSFVPHVTSDDLRTALREAWPETNRVVTAAIPTTTAKEPVTPATLREIVRSSDTAPVPPPWQPPPTVAAEITPLPPPGSVTSRHDETPAGITVLTLSNGVDVWLRPNPLATAEVAIAALASGGAALATPDTQTQAQLAPRLVSGAGVGGLTPEQRAQQRRSAPITVQPFVTYKAHGLNATARSQDLDAVFNLAHLFFTAPNDDQAAFDNVKTTTRTRLQAQDNDPQAVFQARVNEINFGGFALMQPPTAAAIAGVDPAAALRFYRDRFSNAADFTFFVTGRFSIAALVPLLEKYVGSLPSTGAARGVPDPGLPSFPSSVVKETVRKGHEPRSQVALTFFADAAGDAAHEERATAVASILQTRLMQRLRGVLGATYNVSARWATLGPGYGTIAVGFVCAPDSVDMLTSVALEEARRLQRDGPTPDEVATAKAARATELKARMAQNAFWIDAMERARREDRPPSSVLADPDVTIAALTTVDLKNAARQYLPADRYTLVTLLPAPR